jgi:DNA segregation ATPase FtsK/SpoIIIE, S-DNA-T family
MARSSRGTATARPKRSGARQRPARPPAARAKRRPATSRAAANRTPRQPILTPEQRREVGGVVLIGLGVVVAAVLAVPGGGSIAAPVHDHLVDALGAGAWIVATGIVVVGARLLGRKGWSGGLQGALGAGLAAAASLGFLGLIDQGSTGSVGDRIGGGLGDRLGAAAAAVALLAAGCVGLVLAIDLRVGAIVEAGRRRLEEHREAVALAAARAEEEAPVQTPASSPPRGRREELHLAGTPATNADGAPLGRRQRRPPEPPPLDVIDDVLVPVLGLGLDAGAPLSAVAPVADPTTDTTATESQPGAAPPPVAPFRREFEGLPVEPGEPVPGADDVAAGGGAGRGRGRRIRGAAPPAGATDATATNAQAADAPALADEPERVWVLPSTDLLEVTVAKRERLEQEIRATIETIHSTLGAFGVDARVKGVNSGPTVTQYELQPAKGVPVRKITGYQTDLSLALAAPIRIQAPIPGKAAIGIEVPNKAAQLVTLRDVVTSAAFANVSARLPVALGADVSGVPVAGDLTRMPHLLIAGATGSGKSVCINAILGGLLLQRTPAQLKLILIDPKRVELSNFMDIPHLLVPVVVEPEAAVASLRWAVKEMEERYKLFAAHGARNIQAFNERAGDLGLDEIPFVVIVVDELADLMMVAAGEIEDLVCRIAQLARAVGIHLIVATQRPSADIITGLIKANIPSRVAFAVSSGVDSRVILDEMGAEKLLGRGDMLYLPIDEGKPRRLQGGYVSDRELDRLIAHWKAQGLPTYQEEIFQVEATVSWAKDAGKRDPLFAKAAHTVAAEGRAAASLLQRKLNVGYTRAARLVDQLAEHRIVGPYEGSKSREVLMGVLEVDDLLAELGEE